MPEFDVVDLGPTEHVSEGDTAPDFTRPLVNAEFWEDRALAEFAGDGEDAAEPVVLAFTPMVGGFVAEYVLKTLADRSVGEHATVLGVTISSPYEISRFLDRLDLPFAFFTDPANDVAEAYGVVHDLDGMAGVEEPRPAIFVLDEERTVRYAWVATEWPEFPDYDDVAAAVTDIS